MVVYGGAPRAPTVLFNEKVTARLGRELASTGRIPEQAMEMALAGLRRFRSILTDIQVTHVDVIATAAPRLAENGPEFLDQVRACGFNPTLLSGEEEACISAMGVIGAFPGARGVVADLGGGSLELVEIDAGQAIHGVSLPLGTLILPALRAEGPDRFKRRVNKALKGDGWAHPIKQPLYMVGGTWRAMAAYTMAQAKHPLTDPHGLQLDVEQALAVADRLTQVKSGKLNARVSEMRAEMLPDAAALLQILIAKLQPSQLIFSSWGLREGRLFSSLQSAAKGQDPLLAGVAGFTASRGGPPTLATRIAAWTVNALPKGGPGTERVRLAATMLALASMQVEPNFRVRQAVNWALYKRWIDLSDEGRAMMAAALCSNCGTMRLPSPIAQLASQPALDEAVCWGLAIRLARRLGAGSAGSLRNSSLIVDGDRLVLNLAESHAALWADHVQQDLATLAARVGLTPAMEIVSNDELLKRGTTSRPQDARA